MTPNLLHILQEHLNDMGHDFVYCSKLVGIPPTLVCKIECPKHQPSETIEIYLNSRGNKARIGYWLGLNLMPNGHSEWIDSLDPDFLEQISTLTSYKGA